MKIVECDYKRFNSAIEQGFEVIEEILDSQKYYVCKVKKGKLTFKVMIDRTTII